MIASTLFSTSHILMTVAAIVLVIALVWRLTTKCQLGHLRKRNLITRALLIAVLTTVGIGVYPILFKKKNNHADAQKGDIEKTGGTIFICKITPMRDENGETVDVTPRSVQQVIETIENRLSALKLKGFKAEAQGTDKIRIALPEVFSEKSPQIRKALEQTARLELQQVHRESRTLGDSLAAEKEENRVLPPGYELYVYEDEDDDGQITKENILLKRRAALDGSYVIHAQELYGPYEGQLSVELNDRGAEKMFALTKGMQHGVDRLAIVLDGEVLSAPVVQDSLGAKFQISGMKDAAEARNLAAALLNPHVQPLVILEERTVSAELALRSAQMP